MNKILKILVLVSLIAALQLNNALAANVEGVHADKADAGKAEKAATKYSFEERLRFENFAYPLLDKKRTGKKNFIQSRFRVKMEEELSNESKLTLTFQDYRFFEREPASDASISRNDFTLYNAILEIRNFAGIDGLFAKIGRQELTFGNLRILGNSNWSEGLVWDGVRLIYKTKPGTFNLLNFDMTRHDLAPPVQIRGLYYVCDKFKGMELYALKYVDRNRVAGEIATTVRKDIDINTFGVNYTKKFGERIEANVETAFQNGDWGPEKHRASAFHAEAKYKFPVRSKYCITFEYNAGSGDKDSLNGEHGTFCNLFPTNHTKYGYMDLMSWQNMKEFAIRNEFEIRKDLRAKLNYHVFRLQNSKDAWYRANKSVFDSRRDVTGAGGDDIGSEIDLVLTRKMNANLEIEAGISKFRAGGFVKNTASAGGETVDPSWGYLQILKKW
jgi:hypothetical protein